MFFYVLLLLSVRLIELEKESCMATIPWRCDCCVVSIWVRFNATSTQAIETHFLPPLQGVLAAMAKADCLSQADLEVLTAAWLEVYLYFQKYSWDATWASTLVSFDCGQEGSPHSSS